MINYCFNCMNSIEDNKSVCPHCGKTPVGMNQTHQLKPGTLLRDRYLVGRALGQGGFGITYIGLDTTLDLRVAIKEYYPNGISNRNHEVTDDVTQTSNSAELYDRGKFRFLQEAKTLARFSEEPGVVSVRDFFEANNTAYIVMEYLDGVTLKRFVESRGKIPPNALFRAMRPIMRSLDKVHAQGVIHRDISPDNIMVLRNGTLKLLDFGSAREVGGDKSLSVMLKPGYAPEEQYRSKGKQGAWTDVYALCATMYYCLTGVKPDESVERMVDDTLQRPSELGADIAQAQESVILHGLAVHAKDRYQSMGELTKALLQRKEISWETTMNKADREETIQEKSDSKSENKTLETDRKSIRPHSSTVRKKSRLPLILGSLTALVLFVFVGIRFAYPASNYRKAQSMMEAGQYAQAAAIFEALGDYQDSREQATAANLELNYHNAQSMMEAGQYAQAASIFEALGDYQDSRAQATTAGLELDYISAETLLQSGKKTEAVKIFLSLGDFRDAKERVRRILSNRIAAGSIHTAGLKSDGTVLAVGSNSYGQCDVTDWADIAAIAAGGSHTVGLRSDGTVLAVGRNRYGQCDVTDWADIVAIAAGGSHTVGLRSDGTVLAVGSNVDGRCDVTDWTNIVAIASGTYHTVGLKSDETALAVGGNSYGQCDVTDWADIVAIAASGSHTVGLRSDGTVLAIGSNVDGRCDVTDWTDIVAIAAGGYHTVGLKSDGSVVATGLNSNGQCDVSDWTDIVAIAAGSSHTVGLKSDGTVVAVGLYDDGQCDIEDWTDIRVPSTSPSARSISASKSIPSTTPEPKENANILHLYIEGATYPANITQYSSVELNGEIYTVKGVIALIRGSIRDANGNIVQNSTYYPYAEFCDLHATINKELKFEELKPGYYTYIVSAIVEYNSNANGEEILIEHPFEVLSP